MSAPAKAFNGGVYSIDCPPKLRPHFNHAECTVSAPTLNIVDEYRYFVVGDKIVGASSYRILGSANIEGIVPFEATEVAENAISKWTPDDVFCLDVGFDGSRYGIVEANCFNAARYYGANVIHILKAICELFEPNS